MTNPQYILTIAHFRCGCAYRTTSDTPVFCPEHRTADQPSAITEIETLRAPTAEIPDIPGLVTRNYPLQDQPVVLRNNGANSLHTTVAVTDAQGHEWNTPDDDQVGLCAACYIDDDDLIETRISACECPDTRCTYRWCGALKGLHAYWRPHVQGNSFQLTAICEDEIFSFGPFSQQPDTITDALNQERESLTRQVELHLSALRAANEQPQTAPDAAPPPGSAYTAPWLQSDYQLMSQETGPQRRVTHQLARKSLSQKITRLYLIGALPHLDPNSPPLFA